MMKYAKDFNDLLISQTCTACSVANVTYEQIADPYLTKAERAVAQFTDKIRAYDELVSQFCDLGNELQDDGVFAERPRLEAAYRDVQLSVVSKLKQLLWSGTPSVTTYKEDVYYKTWWDALQIMDNNGAGDEHANIATDFPAGSIGADVMAQTSNTLSSATMDWLDELQRMSNELDKEIRYLQKRISKYQKADTNVYER